MTEPDLYAVLEVSRGAGAAEIRAAFRRLARAHHPDLGGGSVAHMALVNRAYATLSNPDRRRAYDAALDGGRPPPPPPAPEMEPQIEEPPWRLDLERGDDMDDWRQMYAEERQLWEQLLRSRPADGQMQAALERALRDQLELENAVRLRAGEPPLAADELEAQLRATRRTRSAEVSRVGCALVVLTVVMRKLAR